MKNSIKFHLAGFPEQLQRQGKNKNREIQKKSLPLFLGKTKRGEISREIIPYG